MKRAIRSIAAASLLAVTLGSCSQTFAIAFSGFGPNIRLEFLDRGLFHSGSLPTCVSQLTVFELIGPTGREDPVWQISSSGSCITLTGVDIGHVPSGFVETNKRLPLYVGHRYQASVHADQKYPTWGLSPRWFVCEKSPELGDWVSEHKLRELPTSCVC